MKKMILFAFMVLLLSGCTLFRPHKIDIEQGNIITENNVSRLHPGMTEAEVKTVMGSPMLVNIFTPDRIDYVYTFQKGYQQRVETRVICLFQHGRLTVIRRSGV